MRLDAAAAVHITLLIWTMNIFEKLLEACIFFTLARFEIDLAIMQCCITVVMKISICFDVDLKREGTHYTFWLSQSFHWYHYCFPTQVFPFWYLLSSIIIETPLWCSSELMCRNNDRHVYESMMMVIMRVLLPSALLFFISHCIVPHLISHKCCVHP